MTFASGLSRSGTPRRDGTRLIVARAALVSPAAARRPSAGPGRVDSVRSSGGTSGAPSQTDTVICGLDKIAEENCGLVNDSAKQATLQACIADGTRALRHMYAAAKPVCRPRTHPGRGA